MPLPGRARDYISDLLPYKYYPEKSLFPREQVNEIMKEHFGWTVEWETMGDFFKVVERKGISANYVPLVGHGAVRQLVMGEGQPQHPLSWREQPTSEGETVVVGPSVGSGTWTHLVMVRRWTTTAATVAFWVDGVLFGTSSVDGASALGSSADLWLGCQGGTGGGFVGELDEVRVSGSPLYVAGVTAPTVPTSPYGPAATTELLLHFDHTRAGLSHDASAGGHEGLWQGATASPGDPFSALPTAGPVCGPPTCRHGALAFDPLAGPVASVPDPVGLDGHDVFTVEFFLCPDSATEPRTVLGRSSATAGGADWHLVATPQLGSGVRLRWWQGQITGIDTAASAGELLPVGEWAHVAVVYARSGDTTTVRFFVNGVPGSAQELDYALPLVDAQDLVVGSLAGVESFFDGPIDEIRFSHGAVYDAPFAVPERLDVRWDTLALYHLDAGAGAYAYDVTPWGLPPMELAGIAWTSDQPPALAPCP